MQLMWRKLPYGTKFKTFTGREDQISRMIGINIGYSFFGYMHLESDPSGYLVYDHQEKEESWMFWHPNDSRDVEELASNGSKPINRYKVLAKMSELQYNQRIGK